MTAAVAATSVVCVHTSVDSGKPMQITVVDPPPDQGQPRQLPPLKLIAPVVTLMKYLETLQQFRALTGTAVDAAVDGQGFWAERDSRQFLGVRVGCRENSSSSKKMPVPDWACSFAARDAFEPLASRNSLPQTYALFRQSMDTLLGANAPRLPDPAGAASMR